MAGEHRPTVSELPPGWKPGDSGVILDDTESEEGWRRYSSRGRKFLQWLRNLVKP